MLPAVALHALRHATPLPPPPVRAPRLRLQAGRGPPTDPTAPPGIRAPLAPVRLPPTPGHLPPVESGTPSPGSAAGPPRLRSALCARHPDLLARARGTPGGPGFRGGR